MTKPAGGRGGPKKGEKTPCTEAKSGSAPAKKIEPGPRNKAAIEAAIESHAERPTRSGGKWERRSTGELGWGPSHSDAAGWFIQLKETFATTSTDFANEQVTSLEAAARRRGTAQGESAVALNAALALVGSIGPENELEAALAVQMAQVHNLSAEIMVMARTCQSIEAMQGYVTMATKLQRTFTSQIEALGRMRGKGQQTVRVEHVTVEPGGQAIVGDVHHYGAARTKEKPNGTDDAGTRASLPCPDPLGPAVPIASDAERAVQDARGKVARAPARKSKCA
jgi:hypothetical protein